MPPTPASRSRRRMLTVPAVVVAAAITLGVLTVPSAGAAASPQTTSLSASTGQAPTKAQTQAICSAYRATLVGKYTVIQLVGSPTAPSVAVKGNQNASGAKVRQAVAIEQRLMTAITNGTTPQTRKIVAPVVNAFESLLALIRHDGYRLSAVNADKHLKSVERRLLNPSKNAYNTLARIQKSCQKHSG